MDTNIIHRECYASGFEIVLLESDGKYALAWRDIGSSFTPFGIDSSIEEIYRYALHEIAEPLLWRDDNGTFLEAHRAMARFIASMMDEGVAAAIALEYACG